MWSLSGHPYPALCSQAVCTATGRRRHPELRRGHYGGLDFHGPAPGAPDFSDASRLGHGHQGGTQNPALCTLALRAVTRRRRHPELRRGHYGGLDFHGPAPGAPDFSDASRLVAWSLGDGAGGGLYIAFNASHRPQVVELPQWPGRAWRLVADTGKARHSQGMEIDLAARLRRLATPNHNFAW